MNLNVTQKKKTLHDTQVSCNLSVSALICIRIPVPDFQHVTANIQ